MLPAAAKPAPCAEGSSPHLKFMKAIVTSRTGLLLCAALLAPVTHVLASDVFNQKAADQLSLIKFALPEYPSYLQQLGIT